MAVELKYICDTCQGVKGKANKWWVLHGDPFNFTIAHFSEERAKEPQNKLACGERCLNQSISGWCEKVSNGEALSSDLPTGKL